MFSFFWSYTYLILVFAIQCTEYVENNGGFISPEPKLHIGLRELLCVVNVLNV